MTATINASTSSGVVITPDNSGNILLQYNGQSAPAFSAYASTGTSVTANTWAKITLDSESFDTNSNFASSRFTPTVAGYYQISAGFGVTSTSVQNIWIAIYKNGVTWQTGILFTSASGVGGVTNMSTLVYCNGSTDYIELYGLSSVTQTLNTGSTLTYMNGCLLRGA